MSQSLPDGHRVYAIGDIHGMSYLLSSLLDMIAEHMAAFPPKGPVWEVFLGDYVDRGPDSAGVIEMLLNPPKGRERVCLLGNHEDAMIRAADDEEMLLRWLSFGGDATCRSYGVNVDALMDDLPALQTAIQEAVPERHLAFLAGLQRQFVLGDLLFVHAGINPRLPVDAQDPLDLIWIRDPFLHFDGPLPKHVVHGHTPVRHVDRRANRTNVDTAAVFGGALTAAILEGPDATFLSAR